MGLRERKAQQTRERIVEVALARFATQGYDRTTMEGIAAEAGVHPATLYRYFPSKDQIVLAEFATSIEKLAETFEDSSPDLRPEAALMQAIDAVLEPEDQEHREQRRQLRAIIDQSPPARARVWDLLAQQRRRLADEIGRRTGTEPTAPRIVLTARLAVLVAETAADLWRDGDGETPGREIARDLARLLADGSVLLPDAGADIDADVDAG
ncbi:TetR/AcrR family transcriptional regulator [Brachybacterium kimchii]|uniref:TetR/AcrR family transcriptional regulator n=1 Tax=Brachybacterium kimchii TaxID=2942909 RepID=A0ABY4NA41_9MICO|nr:TetR/AcrR family transcriptional regulator [Brachybacterium kimchii]UQN31428.1 TetR/AcrR family transcriptional regulator [Brachybacterium kimchii]